MALKLPPLPQRKPEQKQTYLVEAENGDLVSVPEDKLGSWAEAQKAGGLSPERKKQLLDELMRMM